MDPALQIVLLALALACYGYAQRRRWWPRVARIWAAGLPGLAEAVATQGGRVITLLGAPKVATVAAGGALLVGTRVATPAWLNVLNDQPDNYPHTLIIGPTGAGKTTFTMALLAARPGRVAVLTPKPDPRDWPGVPIVTIDDRGEFGELIEAFILLGQEVRRRLVATRRGLDVGEPLTIVCDDWPVLASECGKVASDLFKLVGRLGRSLRVRLVVLSQSERVKSLGLDGEGDAVTNFVRVDLARNHTAQLLVDGHMLALDTSWVPHLAGRATNPARWWFPAEPVPAGALSASGNRFPAGSDLVPGGSTAAEPVPDRPEPVPDPEAEKIRALDSQGWSRNQIASELGGRKADALERIRRVLDGPRT